MNLTMLLLVGVLAFAGAAVAPGNAPGEFPGPGEFPANPPNAPTEACDHLPDGGVPASGNVPAWVNLPACEDE